MLAGTPSRRDTDEALGAFGIDPGSVDGPDANDEALELWPEHETPLLIFSRMLTQWRMGPSGPIGLDYTALALVEQRLGVKRRAAREAFPALQKLEAEALRWFGEQR